MSALKINMLQRAAAEAVFWELGSDYPWEGDATISPGVLEDLTNLAAYAPKAVIERTIKKWETKS